MSERPDSAKIFAFPSKGSRENIDNKQMMELDNKRFASLQEYLNQFPETPPEQLERTHLAIGPLSKEYLIGVINAFNPEDAKDAETRIVVYRAFVEQLTNPEKTAALFSNY